MAVAFGRFGAIINRLFGPITVLGRAVLALGAGAWLVGTLFEWRELHIIAAACLVAVLIGMLCSIGRTTLDVAMVLNPARVTAGETAIVDFAVTNRSPRRMLPVRLEVPVGNVVAVVGVPSLPADDVFEETITIPTTRRSVLAVGPTRSVRGDPLGLVRRDVVLAESEELFVHPVTSLLAGLSSGWMRDIEGNPTNDRSPNDVAFHTLREYVPGDELRHVHWKTTARLGTLMVRQFIDNRRSSLGLVFDTNPASYADADEFELAISMGASLGLKAIRDGQEVTCVSGGQGVASHTGAALLDGLARAELGVPTLSMVETAIKAAPLLGPASIVAVITGSALSVGEMQQACRYFSAESQLVTVCSAMNEPPAVGRVAARLTISADNLDSFAKAMWTLVNS